MRITPKPTLHLDELAPAEAPFAVRVIQIDHEDYAVQYKVADGCAWIDYSHVVHAREIAERIADRLIHPFIPKVLKTWDCAAEHKEQPRPYTVVDITCPWGRDNPFFVTFLLRKPEESIEEMLIRYRTHPYGILLFEGGLTLVNLDSFDRGMISEKIAEAELAEEEEKKNRIQGTTGHVQ